MTFDIDPRNGLAILDLKTAMRAHVERVLEYCGGEVRWAARELGVNETTVRRWLNAWRDGRQASELRVVRPMARKLSILVMEGCERAEA